MTKEQIQTYLKGVFDIEMHRYVLEKTIDALAEKREMLGRRKAITRPTKRSGNVSFWSCFTVTGIIGAVLGVILMWPDLFGDGFFMNVFMAVIVLPLTALLSAVVFGLPLGIIVWLIRYFRERALVNRRWERDMENYELALNKENDRLRMEERKKAALAAEINSLQQQLTKTNRNLSRLYAYGVLNRDYQNLYAVAIIYSYFCKGRTHSLQFDPRTGDPGAYNLFENEWRLDRIITNTEEILYRLDEIAQNQRDLKESMQNATRQISTLCNKVSAQLNTISNSVAATERNTGIIAYNTACIESETRFMAWMTALYGR